MTGQQSAIEIAKRLMDQGKTADEANIEMVRIMGVKLIQSKLNSQTRSALMMAVKNGRLGRIAKDGLKPEAFFHPNSNNRAKELRNQIALDSIKSIQTVCG